MPVSKAQLENSEDGFKPFVFDKLLADGIKQGFLPARNKKSREWYREKARSLTSITSGSIISNANRGKRAVTDVRPGTMFFYAYDPKHKETLPYYDIFPVIFAVDMYEDGFLGINLHYLPYSMRGKLMDALYKISSDKRFTPQTQLKLSYRVLKGASQMSAFKPCLKRYLYGHIRSKIVEVYPVEWDAACFLPVANFKKKSQQDVWSHSIWLAAKK
jgi:hypothetical protein